MKVLLFSAGAAAVSGLVLRPKDVSNLLVEVEKDWLKEALVVLQSDTTKAEVAEKDVKTRCRSTFGEIISAASGSKSILREYMGDVCRKSTDYNACETFKQYMLDELTENQGTNKDEVAKRGEKFCGKFFSEYLMTKAQGEQRRIVDEARVQAEKKKADELAKQKKIEEEKQRKIAAQKARKEAAKKKAEMEAKAKAEAEKKRVEEMKKKKEAEELKKKKEAEELKKKQELELKQKMEMEKKKQMEAEKKRMEEMKKKKELERKVKEMELKRKEMELKRKAAELKKQQEEMKKEAMKVKTARKMMIKSEEAKEKKVVQAAKVGANKIEELKKRAEWKKMML